MNHTANMQRVYDAINTGDMNALGQIISDHFIDHEELPGLTPDKAGTLEFFRSFRAGFPDLQMTPVDVLASDDKVVARGRATGTHSGTFMGIPATSKHIDVSFIDIIRFGADGRAVEHWGVFDQLKMLQQLGLVPSGPA